MNKYNINNVNNIYNLLSDQHKTSSFDNKRDRIMEYFDSLLKYFNINESYKISYNLTSLVYKTLDFGKKSELSEQLKNSTYDNSFHKRALKLLQMININSNIVNIAYKFNGIEIKYNIDTYFQELPIELLISVCQFLDFDSIYNFRVVLSLSQINIEYRQIILYEMSDLYKWISFDRDYNEVEFINLLKLNEVLDINDVVYKGKIYKLRDYILNQTIKLIDMLYIEKWCGLYDPMFLQVMWIKMRQSYSHFKNKPYQMFLAGDIYAIHLNKESKIMQYINEGTMIIDETDLSILSKYQYLLYVILTDLNCTYKNDECLIKLIKLLKNRGLLYEYISNVNKDILNKIMNSTDSQLKMNLLNTNLIIN